MGKFWMVLKWTMLAYCMALWSFKGPFGIFYGHVVGFTSIWYIIRSFGKFWVLLVHFFPFWFVVPTKKNLAALRTDPK
jgi:hypothetical protein